MMEKLIKDNYKYIEYDSDIEFFEALDYYLANGYIINEGVYLAVELKRNTEFLLLSYLHVDKVDLSIKDSIRALKKEYEVVYPDFNDTLLNIDGEIRANFNYAYKFMSKDRVLKKKYKRAAIMILDGLGENILFNNLPEDSFLRRHYKKSINAIYPSTTAAATTSILSGLTPLESGWVGWENYIPEIKKNVILFTGVDFDSGEYIAIDGFSLMPTKPFFSDMDVPSMVIMPDFSIKNYDFNLELDRSIRAFNKNETMIQYIYNTNPDGILHPTGCYSDECKRYLEKLDKDIEAYSKRLPEDTIIIISADHGHTNVEEINLYKFKTLRALLNRRPCNEARCLVFDVIKGKEIEFENLFNSLFKDIYKLYKTKDAIALGFFGINNDFIHERIDTFLGNYVAMATNKYYFKYIPDRKGDKIIFKSHHAGITRDEMRIPIIVIDSEEE